MDLRLRFLNPPFAGTLDIASRHFKKGYPQWVSDLTTFFTSVGPLTGPETSFVTTRASELHISDTFSVLDQLSGQIRRNVQATSRAQLRMCGEEEMRLGSFGS